MAIDFGSAVNAYNQAARSIKDIKPGVGVDAPKVRNSGFSDMVTDSLKEAVATGHKSEEMAVRQIKGEADLSDVITAVANAEHTLETVVAVRDKVLDAYQKILQMPI